MAFGQMPIDMPLFTFASLTLLGWVWSRATPVRCGAFVSGLCLGTGYFTLTFSWIVEPFLVSPGDTGWLAPFALLGLVISLSFVWGVACYAAASVGENKNKWIKLLALWAFLSLSELVRSEWVADFPWGLFSSIWINTALGQSLFIFGPYWLSSLTILTSFLLVMPRPAIFIGLTIIGSAYMFGHSRLASNTSYGIDPIKVRIVQPNVKQSEKWKPELARKFFDRHLELSKKSNLSDIDLIIWPETAVSYFVDMDKKITNHIAKNLSSPVVLGGRRFKNNQLFNSAFLLSASGEIDSIYDKTHLVPFGEYIPFAKFFSKASFFGLATDGLTGFSEGKSKIIIRTKNLESFLILICYEVIFSEEVDTSVADASWIIQITNDAWFGRFSGPQQHLSLARMRAIEQGLPIIRVANTGISAVIDPFGRVKEKIDLGRQDFIDAEVPLAIGDTYYSKIGARNWNISLLCVLLLTILILATITLSNENRKS